MKHYRPEQYVCMNWFHRILNWSKFKFLMRLNMTSIYYGWPYSAYSQLRLRFAQLSPSLFFILIKTNWQKERYINIVRCKTKFVPFRYSLHFCTLKIEMLHIFSWNLKMSINKQYYSWGDKYARSLSHEIEMNEMHQRKYKWSF